MYTYLLMLPVLVLYWTCTESSLVGLLPAPPTLGALSAALLEDRLSVDWAVQIDGGEDTARQVADKYHFDFLGQIGNLDGYYHFRLSQNSTGSQIRKRSLNPAVPGADQLLTNRLKQEDSVGYVEQQSVRAMTKRVYQSPTDPRWSHQWSLLNTGQTDGLVGRDLNVVPAWRQGITGSGVVVTIVDEGVEIQHSELSGNYDSTASYDFVHFDGDPTPDSVGFGEDPLDHGTACAGVVAMGKDNNHCGVGVAYDCNIGGVKLNLSSTSDALEARALGYHNNHIDVYSNSWGPSDYGFLVSKPGLLSTLTLQNGVTDGRSGKGSIYVWASGNGGTNYDSCAADGYASSMYTIAIGSADQHGRQARYDEQCSSKMAVTFSYNSDTFPTGGSTFDPYNQITTAAHNGGCKDDFTGTSAATPLASGVIALVLQANPNLTWRDVQYLIAYTSNTSSLVGGAWTTNGAGLRVSHKFGFGAIDAAAMVSRAQHWVNVPTQLRQNAYGSSQSGNARQYSSLTVHFDITQSSITYLEHVIVKMSLNVRGYSREYGIDDFISAYSYLTGSDLLQWLRQSHPRRGDIKVDLTSPSGTVSHLLPYRLYDFRNDEGYSSWPFMSVHNWGENPIGRWTLTVTFKSSSGYVSVTGLSMSLYGVQNTTSGAPTHPTSSTPPTHTTSSTSTPHSHPTTSTPHSHPTSASSTPHTHPTSSNPHSNPTKATSHSNPTPHTDLIVDTKSNQVPVSTIAWTVSFGGVCIVAVVILCASVVVYLLYRRRKARGIAFHVLSSDVIGDDEDPNSTTL